MNIIQTLIDTLQKKFEETTRKVQAVPQMVADVQKRFDNWKPANVQLPPAQTHIDFTPQSIQQRFNGVVQPIQNALPKIQLNIPNVNPQNFDMSAITQRFQEAQKAVNDLSKKMQTFKGYQAPAGTPELLKPNPLGNALLESTVQSWGKTLDRATDPTKLKKDYATDPGWTALEDTGNVLDFLPFVGGSLKAVKPVVKLLDKAGDAKRILKTIDTVADEAKTVKDAENVLHMKNLLNYGDDLLNVGYTTKQIDHIGYAEAQKILKEGINPLEHVSAQWRGSIEKIKSFVKDINDPIEANRQGYKKAAQLTSDAIRSRNIDDAVEMTKVMDPGFSAFTDVKKKVNILDYLRSPGYVLDKIGMGGEAAALRKGWEGYTQQLPKEIDKIIDWQKRVPSKESNFKIFRFLDGDNKAALNPTEQKVADEIQAYLSDWADKLQLPKDKRVSSYITHLFQKGELENEFPDELAKLIDKKVAGSVYDPFLLARKGGDIPYQMNTWKALDAYVKRGTRKYFMDPALELVEKKAPELELSQLNYVKRYVDRINLRPTEIDNMIDNLVKSTPVGYKLGQRPVSSATQGLRQTIYRGALGLNVGSAIRNLTQGVNTYAKLGDKYTTVGYINMIRNWRTSELKTVGVLTDNIAEQSRQVGVYKSFIKKLDPVFFYLFETAEKINRGAAYYGAKAKALSHGKTLEEAIEEGKKIVRDTQFTFGSIDTPVALQSDLAKTIFQFMNYPVKQSEFLGNMLAKKEWAGLIRYTIGSIVSAFVLKRAFGMENDWIPFMGYFSGEQKFGSPGVQLGIGALKTAAGNPTGIEDLKKVAPVLIPGGAQFKKTIEGKIAYDQGANLTPTGKIRYPIEQNASNAMKTSLFGKYSVPEAQSYFDKLDAQQNKGSILEQVKKALQVFKPEAAGAAEGTTVQDVLSTKNQTNAIKSQIRTMMKAKMPEDKIKAYVASKGMNYEDFLLGELANVPVVERADYVFKDLKTATSAADWQTKFHTYVNKKVITTNILDEWLKSKKITEEELKVLKSEMKAPTVPAIKTASKKYAAPKTKALPKLPAMRRLTVAAPKAPRLTVPKVQTARKMPKLKLKSFKKMPKLRTTLSKLKTTMPKLKGIA